MLVRLDSFYEKVIKVKADVAAILKISFRSRRSRPTITTRPRWYPSGGCARGGQRSALKPPLRGEPRHRCVPALFGGTQRASGVGGARPPRLSPGGNGKGGDQTSLLSLWAYGPRILMKTGVNPGSIQYS